jgi:hypothetical protein
MIIITDISITLEENVVNKIVRNLYCFLYIICTKVYLECAMPGYRRFVTYLFRYEMGKKGENCGFAKVEVRQGRCRIELQIKGYPDQVLTAYLLVGTDEIPKGIPIGELVIKNGVGSSVFIVEVEAVGNTSYSMDDMRGLYLSGSTDQFIASQWDDVERNWANFTLYEEEPKEEGAEKRMEKEDSDETYQDLEKEERDKDKVKNQEKEGGVGEEESSGQELHATQTGAVALEQPYLLADAWEENWQRFTAMHPVFCPFDEDDGVFGVKMELRDFKILPKEHWNLANNSFLLHGYFNYHYVLFGYMEGEQKRWFVGIPGIFQNQEQLLAGIFGFPEFRTKQLTRQKTGEFGYWYRYLNL